MSYRSDKVQGKISIYSIRETDNMVIPDVDEILSSQAKAKPSGSQWTRDPR